VLRLYERQGARVRVTLGLPEGWRPASALNLLEDRMGEPSLTVMSLLTPGRGAPVSMCR